MGWRNYVLFRAIFPITPKWTFQNRPEGWCTFFRNMSFFRRVKYSFLHIFFRRVMFSFCFRTFPKGDVQFIIFSEGWCTELCLFPSTFTDTAWSDSDLCDAVAQNIKKVAHQVGFHATRDSRKLETYPVGWLISSIIFLQQSSAVFLKFSFGPRRLIEIGFLQQLVGVSEVQFRPNASDWNWISPPAWWSFWSRLLQFLQQAVEVFS